MYDWMVRRTVTPLVYQCLNFRFGTFISYKDEIFLGETSVVTSSILRTVGSVSVALVASISSLKNHGCAWFAPKWSERGMGMMQNAFGGARWCRN
jgi:hypothetical protein